MRPGQPADDLTALVLDLDTAGVEGVQRLDIRRGFRRQPQAHGGPGRRLGRQTRGLQLGPGGLDDATGVALKVADDKIELGDAE